MARAREDPRVDPPLLGSHPETLPTLSLLSPWPLRRVLHNLRLHPYKRLRERLRMWLEYIRVSTIIIFLVSSLLSQHFASQISQLTGREETWRN
jgi:hypothetical protein